MAVAQEEVQTVPLEKWACFLTSNGHKNKQRQLAASSKLQCLARGNLKRSPKAIAAPIFLSLERPRTRFNGFVWRENVANGAVEPWGVSHRGGDGTLQETWG
jgi:hypothetical protein